MDISLIRQALVLLKESTEDKSVIAVVDNALTELAELESRTESNSGNGTVSKDLKKEWAKRSAGAISLVLLELGKHEVYSVVLEYIRAVLGL